MSKNKNVPGGERPIKIQRDEHGVPTIVAESWEDALYGLGWVHGRDRGGQICVTRIVAQGRLCELIRDTPLLLALDRDYRRRGFARHGRRFADRLEPAVRRGVEAYCRGVNGAWAQRRPAILHLLRYRPEPLAAADVLALTKLMSFLGLAEGQRIAELFVVHAVRRGAGTAALEELFPALDSLDPELIRGLRAVPGLILTEELLGRITAGGSNVWAVSGKRSASGSPILCNDPHLQADRLPALFYEARLRVGTDWAHGGTIPGLPGILAGRNAALAWGVTSSCADSADFFVERCRNGHYRRGDNWLAFEPQPERILRKGAQPEEFTVYENPHGVLEGDPNTDGDYLCWGWSGLWDGGTGTLKAFQALLHCRSVAEARRCLAAAEIPHLNLALADRAGNVGFQMIGRVPRRRPGWSGLAPVAGWDPANDWQGWLDYETEIPGYDNPEDGVIATANEARQTPDGPRIVTIAQPPYRQQRIVELLAEQPTFDLAAMQAIHYDVLSPQARRLLPVFLNHVSNGEKRQMLEAWDLRYSPGSEAASLFENLYREALLAVFGDGGLGREWFGQVIGETAALQVLFGYFDDVLAQDDSHWLPAERRDEVLRNAVHAGLSQPAEPWGERNAFTFRNIFLGGRLPRAFGFDAGPHPVPGCRATVRQSTRICQFDQNTLCAACYHLITDLGTAECWTNLPGGPSESRFSRYYTNELTRWLAGGYKKL